MKLPKKSEDEMKKQGGHKAPTPRGGGAAGRLHQYERAHGLEETDVAHPATDESSKRDDDDDDDARSRERA